LLLLLLVVEKGEGLVAEGRLLLLLRSLIREEGVLTVEKEAGVGVKGAGRRRLRRGRHGGVGPKLLLLRRGVGS